MARHTTNLPVAGTARLCDRAVETLDLLPGETASAQLTEAETERALAGETVRPRFWLIEPTPGLRGAVLRWIHNHRLGWVFPRRRADVSVTLDLDHHD